MIRFEASRRRPWPVVVSVPHSGLELPPERAELARLPRGTFLRDVDYAVDRIWEKAARELDLPLVVSRCHRYALDLNRRDDQVDARSVEGHPVPEGTHPKGLFWLTTTRLEPLLPAPLPAASYRSLVESVWRPQRERLRAELEEARRKFGFAILIDGHSMPSKGTSYHADPSAARSDVVPGDALGKSCDARLTAAAVESCAVAGLSCKPNDPYTGGGITQAFGRPADRVHALQIEMNRRLYMDEESFEVDEAGLARLQSFAREFLDRAVRLKL